MSVISASEMSVQCTYISPALTVQVPDRWTDRFQQEAFTPQSEIPNYNTVRYNEAVSMLFPLVSCRDVKHFNKLPPN